MIHIGTYNVCSEFRQDLEQMITTLRPDLAQPAKKAKKANKAAVVEAKPRILLCTPIPAFKSTWNISDSVITNAIIPVQQEVAKKLSVASRRYQSGGSESCQSSGCSPP